jgi:hypothetical protein
MKKNRSDLGDNGGGHYLRMLRRFVFRSPHPLELVLVYGAHFLLSTLCCIINININLSSSSAFPSSPSSSSTRLDSVHSSSSFFGNTTSPSFDFLLDDTSMKEEEGGDGLSLQKWLLFTSIGFSFYTFSEYWFHRLLLHHIAQKVSYFSHLSLLFLSHTCALTLTFILSSSLLTLSPHLSSSLLFKNSLPSF